MKKFIITIILLGAYFSVGSSISTTFNPCDESWKEYFSTDTETIIRNVLKREKVSPFVIELLVAQSKHESGNYTSKLTLHNNLFGRHYSKIDTFAISDGATAEGHSRFAIYPSVEYATLSQLAYLKRKGYSFKWNTAREYAVELKRKRYYEADISVYANSLNRLIKQSSE
jgi:uncharacterized FlgJ-related protein